MNLKYILGKNKDVYNYYSDDNVCFNKEKNNALSYFDRIQYQMIILILWSFQINQTKLSFITAHKLHSYNLIEME